MKVENIIVLSQVLGKECSKCRRVKNVDCFDYKNKKTCTTRRGECKACRSQKNKEYRLKMKKSIDCACGGKYIYLNRKKHFNSIKHKKFLENS